MAHLYVAYRSDNPEVLKVGRSNDPEQRCAGLQSSHCFEVKPLAVWPNAGSYETAIHHALEALKEPGPGREWLRASPAEIYAAVALAMRKKRRRSPSPRSVDDMALDLRDRLEIAASSASASLQAEIDDLARRLYGINGPRVVVRAGLTRCRTMVGGRAVRRHEYLYAVNLGANSARSWAAIKRPSPPSTSEGSADG